MFKINSSILQLSSSIIHPFIVMNGVQYNHLKHIIDFMYQGEIKVLDSDLEGVLALGDSFQVKGLSSVKLRQKVSLNSDVRTEPLNPVSSQPVKNQKQADALGIAQQNLIGNQPLSEGVAEAFPAIMSSLAVTAQSLPTNKPINIDAKFADDTPLKNYSRFSPSQVDNLSLSESQDEPKNYSKVSLDALTENSSMPKNANSGIGEKKKDENINRIPISIGQPIKIEYLDEPVVKKPKHNPLQLVIRRTVSIIILFKSHKFT